MQINQLLCFVTLWILKVSSLPKLQYYYHYYYYYYFFFFIYSYVFCFTNFSCFLSHFCTRHRDDIYMFPNFFSFGHFPLRSPFLSNIFAHAAPSIFNNVTPLPACGSVPAGEGGGCRQSKGRSRRRKKVQQLLFELFLTFAEVRTVANQHLLA